MRCPASMLVRRSSRKRRHTRVSELRIEDGTASTTAVVLAVIVNNAISDHARPVIDRTAIASAVRQVKVATSETPILLQRKILPRATWPFGHVARSIDWSVHRRRRWLLSDGGG